jgi:hypothetical protein
MKEEYERFAAKEGKIKKKDGTIIILKPKK